MEEKRYIGKIYLDKDGMPHAEFDDRHLISWKFHFTVWSDAKNYHALVCPQCNQMIKTNILSDCDKQVVIDWAIRRGLNYCYKCGHENITEFKYGFGSFGRIEPIKPNSKLDF